MEIKKILSTLVSIAMIAVLLPTTVKATDSSTPSSTIFEHIEPVMYIDEDGTIKNCNDYTLLTNTMTSWNEGWYVVDGEVIINSRSYVNGNVHLILKDEAILTVKGGIGVPKDSHIHIYGQEGQSGILDVTQSIGIRKSGIGGDANQSQVTYSGDITINGGNIKAAGGQYSAAIGGPADGYGGDIIINGGTVNAIGYEAAAIGGGWNGVCGNIIITGGDVTASVKASNYSSLQAAIGTGYQSQYTPQAQQNGIINIFGGIVKASGGNGIGKGPYSNPITINITGGITKGQMNGTTVNKECGIINNTVYGEYILETNYELSNRETLIVRDDATLTIPSNATLTIDNGSTLRNYGNIIVKDDGNLDVLGTIVGGTLTVEDNGITTTTKMDNEGNAVEKTVVYGDGSSVKTENKSDGSTVVTKTDKDGKVTETIETSKDGSNVKTENKSDGSIVVTKTNKDGKVTEIIETSKDGSVVKTENKSDGSSVVTKTDKKGKVTEITETSKDGSVVKTENKSDGSTVITKTDKDGKLTETIETTKDGSSVKSEYKEDGSKVVTKTDKNGKLTEKVTINPNGSYVKEGYDPKLIEGSGSSYDNKDLVFRSDDELINFIKVTVNGNDLDSKNYDVVSGSIKVTLKDEYLKSLSEGTYTIAIVSTNGIAKGTFIIPEEKPRDPTTPNTPTEPNETIIPNTPEKPIEPTNPNVPEKPNEPATPNTGDNSQIYIMLGLLCLSILGGFVLFRKQKKQ